jgi:hypothetical protein
MGQPMDQKTSLPGAQTVLVVEDDPLVRAILMRIPRSDGFAVIDAHA